MRFVSSSLSYFHGWCLSFFKNKSLKKLLMKEDKSREADTGCVLSKKSLINKIKSKKHHGNSELNEQMLLVLQACKIHDISEQKLIAFQTRGGLTGVNVEC